MKLQQLLSYTRRAVDDYEMIGDLKKSKYYYDLGMKQTNLEDLNVLEERKDYFKK